MNQDKKMEKETKSDEKKSIEKPIQKNQDTFFKRFWRKAKIIGKKMWDYGDYLGEKVVWGLGITSSRYANEIGTVETMRKNKKVQNEEENPLTKTEEEEEEEKIDFDQIPDGMSVSDYVYKKGITPSEEKKEKPEFKEQQLIQEEETENVELEEKENNDTLMDPLITKNEENDGGDLDIEKSEI